MNTFILFTVFLLFCMTGAALNACAQMQNTLESLRATVTNLTDRLAATARLVRTLSAIVRQLQDRLAAVEAYTAKLWRQYREARKNIRNLQRRLSQQAGVIATQLRAIAGLQQQLDGARVMIRNQRAVIARATNEIWSLRQTLATTAQVAAFQAQDVATLAVAAQVARREAEEAKALAETRAEVGARLMAEISALRQELQAERKDKQEVAEKAKYLQWEVWDLQDKAQGLENRIENQRYVLKENQQMLVALDDECVAWARRALKAEAEAKAWANAEPGVGSVDAAGNKTLVVKVKAAAKADEAVAKVKAEAEQDDQIAKVVTKRDWLPVEKIWRFPDGDRQRSAKHKARARKGNQAKRNIDNAEWLLAGIGVDHDAADMDREIEAYKAWMLQ